MVDDETLDDARRVLGLLLDAAVAGDLDVPAKVADALAGALAALESLDSGQ